jgi:hypothetical protein
LLLAFAEQGDEANAVLQTERDLATVYLNSDADGIAQGVMEDYTLTNSMGKITTRADDIGEARKSDPKYEIFENYDMKVAGKARTEWPFHRVVTSSFRA